MLAAALFVCYRVEDHDDIMSIFEQQTKLLSVIDQPYFLAELIEAQNEETHTAVCQVCSRFNPFLHRQNSMSFFLIVSSFFYLNLMVLKRNQQLLN